jgi:hypothetical protein
MLNVNNAGCHLCWVSVMLNVVAPLIDIKTQNTNASRVGFVKRYISWPFYLKKTVIINKKYILL